jgi:single-strand DNA-binding protein
VAHTEKFRDAQGNQKEKTVWVDCAYWTDKTAIAPYLKKGTQVYAEGTPDLRTYQKTDGTQGVSLTLRVLSVQLLGSRNSNEAGGSDSYNAGSSTNMSSMPVSGEMTAPVDDLPF